MMSTSKFTWRYIALGNGSWLDQYALADWFTDLERDWIGMNRAPQRVALIWAVKEAAYKACHRAEPFHPRKIEVLLCPSGQIGLWYGPTATAHLARTWRIDRQVAAIVQAGSAY